MLLNGGWQIVIAIMKNLIIGCIHREFLPLKEKVFILG
jgi:hypothetical protein